MGYFCFLSWLKCSIKILSPKYLNSTNVMFKVLMAHISGRDRITEESIRKLVSRQYCKTNCGILP